MGAPEVDANHYIVQAYDILGVPATQGAKPTDVHVPLRARAPGQSEASTTTVILQQEEAKAVAFAQNTRDEVRLVGGDGQISGALAAQPGMKQTTYIAFSAKDYGADATEELSPTLRAGGFTDSHANGGVMPAVAFQSNESHPSGHNVEISPTLRVGGGGKNGNPPAVAFDLRGREGGSQLEGPHDTANIRAASGGSSRSYVAASAVRRLTPVECERLQGFPDNFTAIPWKKKGPEQCPDGPRYKALGNSMAVPVMRWIGERIQLVDDLISVL